MLATKKRKTNKIVRTSVKKQNIVQMEKNRYVECPVIMCTQGSQVCYSTSISNEFAKMFKLDYYDPKTKEGWNRLDGLDKRAAEFKEFMMQPGNFCPIPIILNDRDNSVQIRKRGKEHYIVFDTEKPLYVTEGQGRTVGYTSLFEEGIVTEIPVVIMKVSLTEEIKTAWITNNKRKPVSSGSRLIMSYKSVIRMLEDGIPMEAIDKKMLMAAIQYEVIHKLHYNQKSALRNRFVMPNVPKQKTPQRRAKCIANKKDKTINNNTVSISYHIKRPNMENLIWQVMKTSKKKTFKSICDEISDIVMNFWNALKEVNPIIFNGTDRIVIRDKKTGKEIVLMEGYHTQVGAGCYILYPILKAMVAKGKRTKQEFKRILNKSKTIKNPKWWIIDPNKTVDCQIVNYQTQSIVGKPILDEMGIGLK